jgi:hypothetical protein
MTLSFAFGFVAGACIVGLFFYAYVADYRDGRG